MEFNFKITMLGNVYCHVLPGGPCIKLNDDFSVVCIALYCCVLFLTNPISKTSGTVSLPILKWLESEKEKKIKKIK